MQLDHVTNLFSDVDYLVELHLHSVLVVSRVLHGGKSQWLYLAVGNGAAHTRLRPACQLRSGVDGAGRHAETIKLVEAVGADQTVLCSHRACPASGITRSAGGDAEEGAGRTLPHAPTRPVEPTPGRAVEVAGVVAPHRDVGVALQALRGHPARNAPPHARVARLSCYVHVEPSRTAPHTRFGGVEGIESLSALEGRPAYPVGIGVGDYWEGGTALDTRPRVEVVVLRASEAGLGVGAGGALYGTEIAEVVGDVGVVGVWAYIDADLGHWVAVEFDATDDGALGLAVVGVIESPRVIPQHCLVGVGTAGHTLLVFLGGIGALGTHSHTRVINL